MVKKSENNNGKEKKQPEIQIIKQYIKDLSFEAPNSPKLFFSQNKEQVKANFNIDIKANKINENLFNVDLHFKIHQTVTENTIYLVEGIYSAISKINGEKDEKYYLLVETPRMIFPAVRTLITNITNESGFPPFTVNYIDFEEMYENNKTDDGSDKN